MLKEKILNKKSGIITYGITPPKENTPEEKIIEISQKQIERIKTIKVDGLILYDIQDETERIKDDRPFPFLPTLDPDLYSKVYLKELNLPKIIYRSVGKYSDKEFENLISSNTDDNSFSVYVGAPSSKQQVKLKLNDAYKVSQKVNPNLVLGGVTIPERHINKNTEHLRIVKKMEYGCKFFVSQAVYNVEASKNFLSDYYYYCKENNIEMVPIIFTLSPCGSLKTLEFMKWLGISIPRWLENELIYSEDILEKSMEFLINAFKELKDYSKEKEIPIGCNIESVSIRKKEIEASIELVGTIRNLLC